MGDADRLPMANVSRIVQNSLPKDASVAKEARVALSACATVFVHYITELAVQQCDKRKKVTLTPDDILEALREAEFEDFEQPMKDALQQFRSGGSSGAKKGVSGAKKQKLDDSANGPETSTGRPDADNTKEGEEGEDEAGVHGGLAADGEAGDDDKMEEADDDDGKDDDEKDGEGKDDDGKDDDGKVDEKDDRQDYGIDQDTAPGEADEATDNA